MMIKDRNQLHKDYAKFQKLEMVLKSNAEKYEKDFNEEEKKVREEIAAGNNTTEN